MNIITAITPKRYANGKLVSAGSNRVGKGWVIEMQFGPGAGYCKWSDDRSRVLVHGRCAFIAWRSGSRQWARQHRSHEQSYLAHGVLGWLAWHTGIEFGITKNGGRVPYTSN